MTRNAEHPYETREESARSGTTRLASLLGRTPPFTGMSAGRREQIAARIKPQSVDAGEYVLREGGAPGTAVYLVGEGALELVRGVNVIDVLTTGQIFGHPTLLTGYPPEFSVRAREPSLLYVIPGEVALDVLSRPEGLAFVASTLRERLAHVARLSQYDRGLHNLTASSLVARPPTLLKADATVAEAARTMSEGRLSAVLIELNDGLGIVTTSDLRDKVLVGGVQPEAPVTSVMSAPVRTVAAETPAAESVVLMLDAGVAHLPVLDRNGAAIGILSSSELMALDQMSPFAVRAALLAAGGEDELVSASANLPSLLLALLDTGASSSTITRILTLQVDALTSRLVELSLQRHGPAPVPFAWLALGSGARGELTLASDQDNALGYAGDADQEVDEYFRGLAEDVNRGLARCGFDLDRSGVNAVNEHWRRTDEQWRQAFRTAMESPGHAQLMRASIAFDFRRVAGTLDLTPQLVRLLLEASTRTNFVSAVAATVVETPSPLNFRRRLRGPINIKKTGTQPITNLARFHALANRIAVVPTVDRLETIEAAGVLDPALARSLRLAFERVMNLRLRHHAEALRSGGTPNDAVDTELLDPLTHAELQEALRIIQSAQQLVQSFPLGTMRA